jgi:hypothetical protein
MSSINTSYTYPNLTSYLGGTNTASNSATSGTTTSLATLLGNNNSSDTDSNSLLSFFEQNSGFRSYNLPTDSNGKTVIPTVDEMTNASTPDTKLSLANYVAQSVLMQSDAASSTDNATRISDITGQAQSVLQALATSVNDLTSSGTNSLTDAQQKTTSTTLNAINTALSQIVNLLPKTDAATRTSLTSKLADLDTLAYNIGGLTGTAWTSVTGNSSNTIDGYSASTGTTTSTASTSQNLLNIVV